MPQTEGSSGKAQNFPVHQFNHDMPQSYLTTFNSALNREMHMYNSVPKRLASVGHVFSAQLFLGNAAPDGMQLRRPQRNMDQPSSRST